MTNPDSLCFGLLAGGKSSRMGTDKASLLWRGQPLWQHQLRLAAESGAREILISGAPDGPYCTAASVIPDVAANIGPLAGLAALLNAMKGEWLLAVAVDMPFLDANAVRLLLAARTHGCGVVPRINGRAEPLAAIYPRSLAVLALAHASAADRSLQALVRAAETAGLVKLLDWPVERAVALRNLNTPTEWAAALKA